MRRLLVLVGLPVIFEPGTCQHKESNIYGSISYHSKEQRVVGETVRWRFRSDLRVQRQCNGATSNVHPQHRTEFSSDLPIIAGNLLGAAAPQTPPALHAKLPSTSAYRDVQDRLPSHHRGSLPS